MMHVPVEMLIDGVLRTLREDVLPELPTRAARTRLHTALDVLHNLRDRVEVKAALVQAECDSLASVLGQAAAHLERLHRGPEARALREAVEAAPLEEASERRRALARAFEAALRTAHGLEAPERDPLLAILGQHLASQCVRDVLVLKPSALREISEG